MIAKSCTVIGLVMMVVVACATPSPAPAVDSELSAVLPFELAQLTLYTIDAGLPETIEFLEDGTLLFTVEGETRFGHWNHDANRPLLPYVFSMQLDGRETEYAVSITRSGDRYSIVGRYYLADSLIRFYGLYTSEPDHADST